MRTLFHENRLIRFGGVQLRPKSVTRQSPESKNLIAKLKYQTYQYSFPINDDQAGRLTQHPRG